MYPHLTAHQRQQYGEAHHAALRHAEQVKQQTCVLTDNNWQLMYQAWKSAYREYMRNVGVPDAAAASVL
jgi:hypothetical protein